VLRLRGRRVLVVGGGKVAARRAAGLLDAGAHVTVVSPTFSPAFVRLVPRGAVTCVARPYRAADLADMSLVIAATDDRRVNAEAMADARRAGVWVNVVDNPGRADFIVPAVVRRRAFLLALSSGGASPALVGHLRRELDLLVPEDLGVLVDRLAKARVEIQRRVSDPARRRDLLTRLLTVETLTTLRAEGAESVLKQVEAPTASAGQAPAPPERPPASPRTSARPGRGGRRRRAARIPV